MTAPLLLFYSYNYADEDSRVRLDKHLKLLERNGIIQPWSGRKIMPGAEWKQEIDDNLNRADIVLLLVSADFMASDYCFDIEMRRAMERHQKGEARVIPIILRPVDWKQASFASVQGLPQNGKPVAMWANQDEAWEDVAKGIRKVAAEINRRRAAPSRTSDPPVDKSTSLPSAGLPEDKTTGRLLEPGRLLGSKIGSYQVVRQIGEGGMGVVYEAVNDQIDHRTAIKVLHPRFLKDREIATRFFNEARAANIIRHPGIVSISEFGHLPDGAAYIVMEYLEGESLRARLRARLTHAETVRLCRQMASALSAAHQKHIVHRDLKPDNVMLVKDPDVPGGERTKVLDFGIAKLAEEYQPDDQPGVHTDAWALLGTPAYMAPEQCRGAGQVSDRTDVYALGVILYQMLAGRPPFIAEGGGMIMGMHMFEEPPPVLSLAPGVAPELAELVHIMLMKDPAARPGMSEVAHRLDELCQLISQTPTPAASPALPANRWSGALEQLGQNSTLRQATAQSAPMPARRSRAIFAAGALALILGGVQWTLRSSIDERALTKSADLRAGAGSVEGPAAVSPVPPPPPRRTRVRWRLHTEPEGADVVRVSDQKVLGKTPWEQEQEQGPGSVDLLLRLKNFKKAELTLHRGADADRRVQLHKIKQVQERCEECKL